MCERSITISVAPGTDRRLDQYLAEQVSDISRNGMQRLIADGKVTVDGKLCTLKKYKLEGGEEIIVDIPAPRVPDILPEDIPINIVYEDDEMMVVDKPKGMVVHPGVGNYTGTLVNAIMFHCKDRLSSINGVERPGIVHRIDKDTSGLLMIAKTDAAHNDLVKQLSAHTIARAYRAIVIDNIKDDEGRIDMPIGIDPQNRLRQAVTDINSKEAITDFRVLERFGRYTYIEARLKTGRTHQIRVHMAKIKHPLVGDHIYGPDKNEFGVRGQILHAYLLGFVHPETGEYMEFESPLTEEFERVLEILRGR